METRLSAWLFTSQLGEDVDLLLQDLFQLGGVRLYVIVHLLRHLQQHLLVLQAADGLLESQHSVLVLCICI